MAMTAVHALHNAPEATNTAARFDTAWLNATPMARRALRAAIATSIAIGMLAEVLPMAARITTGLFGVVLAAAATVDVHERRLPNGAIALATWIALAGPLASLDSSMCARAIVGGGIAGGAMLVVRLVRGVGMGDVKAAGAIGVSTGAVSLSAAPMAIAVAAFAAAIYGAAARRQRVPLGPSLWLGWAVALFSISTGWWR